MGGTVTLVVVLGNDQLQGGGLERIGCSAMP